MFDINSEQGKRILASMVGGLIGRNPDDMYNLIERMAGNEIGLHIERVIYDEKNLVTVIIWADGKKTVVKCQPEDEYNKLTGFLLAVCKRVFGNKGRYNDILRKFVPGYGE